VASGAKPAGPVLPFHPGHFYSPIVDPAELAPQAATLWPPRPECAGIDFDPAGRAHLLETVFPSLLAAYDYPDTVAHPDDPPGFFNANSQFAGLDARAAFALLRHWAPRRIVEVGSGFSSLLMADVGRRFLGPDFRLTCIEPFPRAFLRRQAGIELVVAPVQSVDLEAFAAIGPGDVLFIDSSHVAKTGSDVNRLYFDVLPRLPVGARVHIHDVFLPHEYPRAWVLEENRSWNEQYLVRALLMDSTRLRVRFGSTFAATSFPRLATDAMGLAPGTPVGGGSLWLEVVGP
jgi:hypothetical protein